MSYSYQTHPSQPADYAPPPYVPSPVPPDDYGSTLPPTTVYYTQASTPGVVYTTPQMSAIDPPSYDEAVLLRNNGSCDLSDSPASHEDIPPDCFDSVREQPAASCTLRPISHSKMRFIDDDDEVDCLCALFCIAIESLLIILEK